MSVPVQIAYRNQYVEDFHVGLPLLADRFTDESMSVGRSAVFDIHEFGGRMSRRSIDGGIPRRERAARQVTVNLEEYVDKEEITNFEKFISQSDERSKINRSLNTRSHEEVDYVIMNALAGATVEYQAGAAAITQDLAAKVIATQVEKKIPIGAQDLTWIVSPKMEAKLQQIIGYTSSDYVSTKPLETGGNQYDGSRKIKSWIGCGWIVHPNLPNVGTALCTTYLVHRRAIGLAKPLSMMQYEAGKIPGELADYAVCSLTMGAAVLQQTGVIKFHHNDTL